MTLDDIDWDTGALLVRGSKAVEYERLPLPADVGESLALYLRDRPTCETRRVFLTMRAPRKALKGSGSICGIVRYAIKRAGLHPPHRGAYVFRHSLATRMLRAGGSLADIGEILRHQSPDTTAIYAKVDLTSLRTLALPWPGTAEVEE
jgi:integrase